MFKNKVTVAAIQTRVSRSREANLRKTEKMVKAAAARGAKIICLQELFATPYFPQIRNADVKKYAETLPGPTTKIMSLLAKELGVVIIVPFCEETSSGKYYNTAVVFDHRGKLLGKYRKIHIPHDPGFYEKDYFQEGDLGYKIFKTKFATFAVLICYDQWFPEAARVVRLTGAEIIFYPTGIGDIIGYKHPNDWRDAWETIQRGHAIANSVYLAAVNRVGREGRMRFCGQSFVSDPWGKVLKRASKNKDEVLIQKIDLEYNKFLSEGWGFLRNRQPETYQSLIAAKLVSKSKKLKNVAHYKDEIKALEG